MIETAIDELKSVTYWTGEEWVLPAQQKELHSAIPNASDDFKSGYELGVQACRVLISGMPIAVMNKVSF
jgi:hypothetical protein